MQTKACGAFGCHWETRNHGKWKFFWAHDDTGEIPQQVTMSCRPGTHSYRVHMAVVGLASTGHIGENGKAVAGAICRMSCRRSTAGAPRVGDQLGVDPVPLVPAAWYGFWFAT